MSEPANERVPLSVLIAARNEAANLPKCLAPLERWADEIVVVDSHSTDGTAELAERYGAQVLQFDYAGGWPKKRQWALDTFPFRNDWILILDADEILQPAIKSELAQAIASTRFDGYWLRFRLFFLGRELAHGGFDLMKLFLFRKGKGRYERRLTDQTKEMGDIEVHEHVIVDGAVGQLESPIRHENFNSLYRYIAKHNEYSEWEARVFVEGTSDDLKPSFLGSQAERRRWLKSKLFEAPGFPLMTFGYHYVLRMGFLDGAPGLIYCGLKGIQRFHSKAKLYELRLNSKKV
ncbi:MAG: glycosyltransferase family 2 protein [Deltaproteobacteria bacterium]|nr:glycosyltransferase family 2 protein [Deltaproteobacteria bacterium]